MSMKKILLDTNFLLIPAQHGVDIFDEIDRICDFNYELLVPAVVIWELKKLSEKGKAKGAAKLALRIIERKNLRILESKTKTLKNADKIVLDTANKDEFIVATQDKLLKNLLRQKKVPLIVLRQKNHLELLI